MKLLAVAVSKIIEKKKSFPDAEVGGGARDTNAICSRPEVPDGNISGHNVDIALWRSHDPNMTQNDTG